MCGFVGFASPSRSYDRTAVVRAMADAIAHRGPDSEGYLVDEAVALGFRRLSIIDLAGGDQPMETPDGRVAVCFNGEIYNHHALRATLEQAGHVFRTRSDTEVLLHGWEEWGADLLGHLRGMFAFVIYDRPRRMLFLARDPFGIKPLYYYATGDELLFASEVKAFLAHPSFEKRLDERLLPAYLCFEYLPGDRTLFEGVRRLPPATCLTWQDGELRAHRYHRLAFAEESAAPEEWDARIAGAVRDSVRAHAAADVEVGCFLSAGVDSSLVAAEAAQVMDARTFSIGYGEERYSELAAAGELAGTLGLRNTAAVIGPAEFFGSVPAVQYHLDEPLPNPSAIPLYHLGQLAARDVKVVMSGEGADELFGGYAYYQECLDFAPYLPVPAPLRRLAGNVAEALPPFHGRRFLMRGRHALPVRYLRNEYVYAFEECGRYLRAPLDCPPPPWWTADVFAEAEELDEVTAMQYADLRVWLPCDILQKADKMSMAASLELRVPFLDRHVADVALRLPTAERVTRAQTKPALRRAAALSLPTKTAQMPKIGFVTPLAQWLREEPWHTLVRERLTGAEAARFFNVGALAQLLDEHREGRCSHMKRIWSAYCFLVWYDEFFVRR